MEEIWKDVKGFEGFYQISSLGRVKSLPRNGTINSERILKPNNVRGYLQVVLNKKGDKSYKKVHRLVAENFIENPLNKREVNHIDGNKHNNNLSNLEWVTSSENQIHAYKLGLQKLHPRRGSENNLSKKIMQLDLEGNLIRIWDSIGEASRNLSIANQNISVCLRRKQNKTNGYKWEYVKGYEKLDKGRW